MASKPAGKHVRAAPARHSPKARVATPQYSVSDLHEQLLKHVRVSGCRKAFDLGVYEKLLLGQAVRGQGLAGCSALLRCLLTVAPHGLIKHKDLKQVLGNLALQFDEVCHSNKSLDKKVVVLPCRTLVLPAQSSPSDLSQRRA